MRQIFRADIGFSPAKFLLRTHFAALIIAIIVVSSMVVYGLNSGINSTINAGTSIQIQSISKSSSPTLDQTGKLTIDLKERWPRISRA